MTFHLAELVQPGDDSPGAILQVFEAFAEITRMRSIARIGNADVAYSGQTACSNFRDSAEYQRPAIAAIAGPQPHDEPQNPEGRRLITSATRLDRDDVIGVALPSLPLIDNTRSMHFELQVSPDWERRGVGRALYGAVEELARANGRTLLRTFTDNAEGSGPEALRPKDGPFAVAPDAATRFAQEMGFQLAQTERHSALDLTSYSAVDSPAPAGYRYVTWPDHTPDDLLEALAPLYAAMSTDVPLGEYEIEAEVWDAGRVRSFDDEHLRSQQAVTTLALTDEGEPAGFTQLFWDPAKPAVVDQWNTIVLKAHRGHGLGFGLKRQNLVAGIERWPSGQRIHTWNAAENDHMWAINEALGFRVVSIDAGWQKKLS